MWQHFDGKPYTRERFQDLVAGIPHEKLAWVKLLCVHNTASPSIAQWQDPRWTPEQRIVNLQHFYEHDKGWRSGPHGFIPPDQNICIWGFTPLWVPGVHASCFNKIAIGLEMIGNFDAESFTEGPGDLVRGNAIFVLAVLYNKLGLAPDKFALGEQGLHFHIDCKRDNHACPGKNVSRSSMIGAVLAEMKRLEPEVKHTPVAPAVAGSPDPSAGMRGTIAGASVAGSPHPDPHPIGEGVRERDGLVSAETPAPPTPTPSPQEGGEGAETDRDQEPETAGVGWLSRLNAFWDRFNFRVLDELAEKGSRTATSLRSFKGLIWKGAATAVTTGGTAATLVDPNKGTAQVVGSWGAQHPFLLAALCAGGVAIVLIGIAYYYAKKIERGLAAAAKDGRYAPRGAAT